MMIYIILIGIGIAICYICFKSAGEQFSQKKELQNSLYSLGAPSDCINRIVACDFAVSGFKKGSEYATWLTRDKLMLLEVQWKNCQRHIPQGAKPISIPFDNISSYNLIGDEHYVSKVSGGGGGGSSLGGAIVGGAVAGPAGAIIGSRKKTQEVTTSVEHIDNRMTEILVGNGANTIKYRFTGMLFYNWLSGAIPEKEYTLVQEKKRGEQETENLNLVNKMAELKSMLDGGFITQEEFDRKKTEILEKI